MSPGFQPSNSSMLSARWRTIFLVPYPPISSHQPSNKPQSQRDLAGQVPINFVTQIGVSLQAACFGNGRYQDDAAAECLSNLLTVGYRRFILDLYWDSGAQQWSFCPIAVREERSASSSSIVSSAATSNSSAAITSSQSSGTSANATSAAISSASSSGEIKLRRQELSSSTISAPPLTTTGTRTGTRTTSYPLPSSSSARQSLDLGPVSCTSTVDLDILLHVLQDYMEATEDTLQANLLYLTFNLHAAASSNSPTDPPSTPSSSELPSEGDLIGSIFHDSIGSFIYTPSSLQKERSDLNDSWYSAPQQRQPIAEYFTTDVAPNGVHSTTDGWPCENYIEVSRAKRLLLTWGTVDPQMAHYNFTSDDDIIFPQDALNSPIRISSTSSGVVESGCLFHPKSTLLSHSNSSWAQTSDLPSPNNPGDSLTPLTSLTLNLTTCGISPTLNTTLLNTTASNNPIPYQSISYSSLWSWGVNEPRNASSDSENDPSLFRCALLDPALNGRWRVEDCSARYHAACRVDSQPYTWTITSSRVPFSSSNSACPDNSTFGIPRTGLENSYLYSHLLSSDITSDSENKNKDTKPPIWLDFNSLDVRGCWTTGGVNASCPYTVDAAEVQRRTILVPTIAAIVIAIVTALTLFVKCNANRRSSRGAGRRKKRGEGGWDYEGVPS
jgi:hypothetical protein